MIRNENIELRASPAPWNASVQFLMREGTSVARQVVMGEAHEGQLEPSFELGFKAAQTLMDDLWNCGLRPTEGAGSAGAMAATVRHLEDMRSLVFNKAQK